MTRRRKYPRFYMSGVFGEYEVRERANPYQEASAAVVMETDRYLRARVVARALNDAFPWPDTSGRKR